MVRSKKADLWYRVSSCQSWCGGGARYQCSSDLSVISDTEPEGGNITRKATQLPSGRPGVHGRAY